LPGVIVADDQPHPGQPALDQGAHEARPGAALVVAGRQLQAQNAALAAGRHADRHQRRHRHHPPRLAHLEVGGIQPQVGVALADQRAGAEGLDLGVERGAHARHLALGDAVDAQRPDQVVDAAGADAAEVGLLDDGQQRPLGAPPRLEQAREVGPVAHPRDGQRHAADAGVPAPLAIPVAVGQAALRVALALGRAGQLADLGLHDRFGQDADPSRSRSTSPSAPTLRRVSSRVMLASATVVYLLSSVCNSNDVRMARWPLRCSA